MTLRIQYGIRKRLKSTRFSQREASDLSKVRALGERTRSTTASHRSPRCPGPRSTPYPLGRLLPRAKFSLAWEQAHHQCGTICSSARGCLRRGHHAASCSGLVALSSSQVCEPFGAQANKGLFFRISSQVAREVPADDRGACVPRATLLPRKT